MSEVFQQAIWFGDAGEEGQEQEAVSESSNEGRALIRLTPFHSAGTFAVQFSTESRQLKFTVRWTLKRRDEKDRLERKKRRKKVQEDCPAAQCDSEPRDLSALGPVS